MNNDIVKNYTWNILKKQLQQNKVTNNIMYEILDDVYIKLNSLIYHFNDKEFLNAVLIVGSEEGLFYEPKNDLIGNLVVMAIRNSKIEDVDSIYFKERTLNIKDITSKAIEYFSNIDLSNYSKTINVTNDYYYNLSIKYPTAFNSLKELSKLTCEKLDNFYESIMENEYKLSEVENLTNKNNNNYISVIESGYNEEINNSLASFLLRIKQKELPFLVVDSFKYLSRNFEVILKVLEFLLTNKSAFITSNYMITYDYVSRRKDILKASHGNKSNVKKIFENNNVDSIIHNKEIIKRYQ